jgi:hypothetical protein
LEQPGENEMNKTVFAVALSVASLAGQVQAQEFEGDVALSFGQALFLSTTMTTSGCPNPHTSCLAGRGQPLATGGFLAM